MEERNNNKGTIYVRKRYFKSNKRKSAGVIYQTFYVIAACFIAMCIYAILFLVVVFISINKGANSIDMSLGLPAAMSALSYASSFFKYCSYAECESDLWIPANMTKLEEDLINNVYGQHLVREIVVNALKSHFDPNVPPSKALALSFHGWPGSGKNYVSNFIVNSLYKLGYSSKYVHSFNGLIHFPLYSQADIYKLHLIDGIRANVSKCSRSIFIFDEVDKMHERILNAISPFLDFHHDIDGVDFRKAIFIFLSNTGGNLITEKMMRLWKEGKQREQLKLRDFEDLIRNGAFNEEGGFHKCDVIEGGLIDHYVPFLPMEEKHVRQCIVHQFRIRNEKPDDSTIKEVLADLTFGPEPANLYSLSGCKRIAQKVAYRIEKKRDTQYKFEL